MAIHLAGYDNGDKMAIPTNAQRFVDACNANSGKDVIATFMPQPIKTDRCEDTVYYYFDDGSGVVIDSGKTTPGVFVLPPIE